MPPRPTYSFLLIQVELQSVAVIIQEELMVFDLFGRGRLGRVRGARYSVPELLHP